jgi:hypothetical protein
MAAIVGGAAEGDRQWRWRFAMVATTLFFSSLSLLYFLFSFFFRSSAPSLFCSALSSLLLSFSLSLLSALSPLSRCPYSLLSPSALFVSPVFIGKTQGRKRTW